MATTETVTINGTDYDLRNGAVFVAIAQGDSAEIKQLSQSIDDLAPTESASNAFVTSFVENATTDTPEQNAER